ncbi:MAG: MoaD/ThiS family protein [Desulfofundulus sp.]|uniref:MoaD/ThiS family protein n=1 Tax=Desulfofundulus sp. TaxID=2282750 RepID=UPI003C73D397
MEVKVELRGYLSSYAPPDAVSGRITLEIPLDSTVKNVLEKVHIPEKYVGLILINGQKAGMPDRLRQGDTVTIFPVVAGG